MLSIGVLLIIMVIVILLTAFQVIGTGLVVPVFLVLTGCWTIAIAFISPPQQKKTSSYAFGIVGLGVFLIAVGVAWYIFSINWLFSLAVVLLTLGATAIAAALLRK